MITYGETREEAIQIMFRSYRGLPSRRSRNNIAFLEDLSCDHEAFRSGNFDTHFVKKYYNADLLKNQMAQEAEIAAMVALKQYFEDQKIVRLPNSVHHGIKNKYIKR